MLNVISNLTSPNIRAPSSTFIGAANLTLCSIAEAQTKNKTVLARSHEHIKDSSVSSCSNCDYLSFLQIAMDTEEFPDIAEDNSVIHCFNS